VFEFFGQSAKKLTSFPFIATLAIIAIVLTQIEPLKDENSSKLFLYLVVTFGSLFLLLIFHFATRSSSIILKFSSMVLVFVVTLCFAYITVAITSRSFGGPWQPCIMVLDDDCQRSSPAPDIREEVAEAGVESSDPSVSKSSDSRDTNSSMPSTKPLSPPMVEKVDQGANTDNGTTKATVGNDSTTTLGELKLRNGWIYKGRIKDGQPVDKVATLYRRSSSTAETYEGEIIDGRPDGEGEISGVYSYGFPEKQVQFRLKGVFDAGLLIEGIAQDKLLRDRIVISSSGATLTGEYSGEIMRGQAHGSGRVRTYENHLFIGNFNNGYLDGCIERRLASGEVNHHQYIMGRFFSDC
jgi:hypothetical protein